MIDAMFGLCVAFLRGLADWLGTTYQAVNVWIFVVIGPLFTLALVVVAQQVKIRSLRRDIAP